MPKQNIADKVADRIAQGSDTLDKDYNDLFGLPTGTENVVKLQIRNLHLYEKDPFKDRTGEEMEKLADSIRENGLQYPIIVRPMQEKGQYEILAGRRRVGAVKSNGDTEIDAIIRVVDDSEAAMIVTETNLRHRENLFHSEKAFAYRLQLEAIKRQGRRTDLEDKTSTQIACKMESAEKVAEKNDVSKDEIRRYVRITYLIPSLLELVDNEDIPFMAGVDLSYLDESAQTLIYTFFFKEEHGSKLDLKMSASLRVAFKEKGELTGEMIKSLCFDRQKKDNPKTFTISRKKLQPYLDRIPDDTELERLFLEFIESRFGSAGII